MDIFLKRYRIDLILGMSILCLALPFARKRLARREIAPLASDEVTTLAPDSGEAAEHTTPVCFENRAHSHEKEVSEPTLFAARCKLAVRMVEMPDAFVVTLPAQNLDTNSVRISLIGSMLIIESRHAQPENTFAEIKNSLMLPAPVDASTPPTYWLTNNLLQVHVSKPQAIR